MTEITIKFKDRNRSDLKVKLKQNCCIDYYGALVRVPIATKEGISVCKLFSADSIEEITEVIRED